jgi:hypothetical protein
MTETLNLPAAGEVTGEEKALARRKARIQDMRALLDLLDADGSIPLPFGLDDGSVLFTLYDASDERGEMIRLARTLPVRRWGKGGTTYSFEMTGGMAGGLKITLSAFRRSVCERTVTTREVTETVPDPEALALVPMVEVTRTEEVVEWHCPESVLAPAAAEAESPVAA